MKDTGEDIREGVDFVDQADTLCVGREHCPALPEAGSYDILGHSATTGDGADEAAGQLVNLGLVMGLRHVAERLLRPWSR